MKKRKQTIVTNNCIAVPVLIEGTIQKIHDEAYRMKMWDRVLIVTLDTTNRTIRLAENPMDDQKQTVIFKSTNGGKMKLDEQFYDMTNTLQVSPFLAVGKYEFVYNTGNWELIG